MRSSVRYVRDIALLAVLFAATAAQAGRPVGDATEDAVEAQVLGIRATKKHDRVSDELKKLVEQLRKQYKYTGYVLEKSITKQVRVDSTLRATLMDGFRIDVKPTEVKGENVKLELTVYEREGKDEKQRLKTTVTLKRGRFQLLGGWKLKDGEDVLVIAVAVK